ncbi:type IV toxin-antitoxin system AbiEi family antitoxin [uncultured Tessaracoccus sp.]|uniref:type IV toxin-antitoxin system AbiEi family antitoxin n=1 Tax=uncultured Tessaracoccus sp. TaxID=905023 RepID=UPI0025F671E7|nr:type IV toxin-antitoxin system AbiEi family antitoxin [uncultured Tessaracoccus sp.]
MEDWNTIGWGGIARLEELLHGYGIEWSATPEQGPGGGMARVPTPDGGTPLRVAVGADAQGQPDTLLVRTHVTPKEQAELRRERVFHLDLDGNAWIELPGYRLWVEGRRQRPGRDATPAPPTRPAREDSNPAYGRAGAKLVFVLLHADEDVASLPMRRLAELAGISLGATSRAITGLEADGHLTPGDPVRQLRHRSALAVKWLESFRARLLPSLRTTRFHGPTPDEVRAQLETLGLPAVIAGEAVSSRLAQPQTTTIYLPGSPAPLVRALGLRRNDAEPTVIVRDRFWAEGFLDGPIAPPLLTAAELLSSSDPRLHEAAFQELADADVRVL